MFENKYFMKEQIHLGQMSCVNIGIEKSSGNMVIIKSAREDEEIAVGSLRREVEILSAIHTKGIPKLYDVYTENDKLFVVMEYMEGKNLKQLINEGVHMNTRKIQQIGIELCNILLYLQGQNPAIIHRDIKLENIIMGKQISLVDFGAARQYNKNARQDTVCLGTVGFAAPEQFGGSGQSDVRTDIYGVGKTLEKLVVSNSNRNWKLKHIIDKCTKQNPNERYQNIEALMGALCSVDKLFEKPLKIVSIRMVHISDIDKFQMNKTQS